jgi:acetate kinase
VTAPRFVLVVNSGSSSIKYRLHDLAADATVADGIVARIGERGAYLESTRGAATRRDLEASTHAEAFEAIVSTLTGPGTGPVADLAEIGAVGHRVVHGGERFSESVLVTDEVVAAIEACVPLAPLHNPPNLMGIREASRLFPGTPQVAVFDTAFHATIPARAHRYALPAVYHDEHGVRRYGFHGISYRYVAGRAAALIGRDATELRLVVCHLGNGASMTAIVGGRSVDTSMGMTPLEGLVMGTRSGDLDPGIVLFLLRDLGMSPDAVDRLLNNESGLLGLSGASNDLRVVTERAEAGDEAAQLALDVFAYRARKYVGAYAAAMGGLDALVFTAGIGENSPSMRDAICAGLGFLGIELDRDANAAAVGVERDVSAPGGRVRILVVPTDEERMMVLDTIRVAGLG